MLLLKKVLIACLKFKFHWAFCTLSHNPVTVSTKASITWRLCPGLMDSFPRWLLNEPSKLTVVVCRRNQFLATRISFWAAWASLCWQLASSRVGDSREGSATYDLALKVTHCHFWTFVLIAQAFLFTVGRGLQEHQEARIIWSHPGGWLHPLEIIHRCHRV